VDAACVRAIKKQKKINKSGRERERERERGREGERERERD
jgi:hypothetical protein